MIGIMDWGIGGLSVYQALRRSDSSTDVIYVSDAGFTPYGKTEREVLRARLRQIAKFYDRSCVTDVIVACNAASCALDSDVETFDGVRFSGIISSGVRAVAYSIGGVGSGAVAKADLQRIGVIGGELTIKSEVYQHRLRALLPAWQQTQVQAIAQNSERSGCFVFTPAQPLSALVEAGALEGSATEAAVADVLKNLGAVDAVLLACTHYPALSPIFKKLSPTTALLDPADFIQPPTPAREAGKLKIFTSGSIDGMRAAARAAWSLNLDDLSRLPV